MKVRYKDVVIKIERSISQWNRIESQEIDPRIYEQLIVDTFNGEKIVISTDGTGAIGYPYAKQ